MRSACVRVAKGVESEAEPVPRKYNSEQAFFLTSAGFGWSSEFLSRIHATCRARDPLARVGHTHAALAGNAYTVRQPVLNTGWLLVRIRQYIILSLLYHAYNLCER